MGDEHPKAVAILMILDVKTVLCDWHIVGVGVSMLPTNLVSHFGNPFLPLSYALPSSEETQVWIWIYLFES